MAISWKLKTYLSQNHDIHGPTGLQRKIRSKTGVIISLQNLCNYMNTKPKAIRLETILIICSALNCQLSDFCQVKPQNRKWDKEKKLSYKNTPHQKRGVISFPEPENY